MKLMFCQGPTRRRPPSLRFLSLSFALAPAVLFVSLFVQAAGAPARAIEIEKIVSPGGLEAWLVQDHLNPIVSVRFSFRGGASLDPVGKEGLAQMVSTLLDEGAGEMDSQAFQGRLEDLSITLRFHAGRDNFGGTLKTLTKNRDAAFDLLALALTQARFDDKPLSRIRAQLLSGLKRESEDPDTIASLALSKKLFPDHPYGRPVQGTAESISAIDKNDLKSFVRERLARANLVVGVVGNITPEELEGLLDKTFGKLPAISSPWKVPDVEPAVDGKTIVINKAVPQSSIIFAQAGVKRNDPDFYAAFVLNHILGGGGFTSRLYDQVREKRGLAYSVYSSLYPLDFSALLLGGAGTANARAAETLQVVRDEWRRMADFGVTADELANAKTYLTGSFPLRFTSSGRIASTLVAMQLDDLGIDYLERRNGYVEAVTLEDINRLAKSLLRPDLLTVIVVGEPENLAASE